MNVTDIYAPTPKKARIEIIPLIDVIFFLLATFVLFTLSLDKIASIETRLPDGGVEKITGDRTIYLQASEAGTLYWKQGRDGLAEPISAAELPARLAEYRRTEAAPRVMIGGDFKAKFGVAVLALDEVRKAGIHEVTLETVAGKTGQ